MDIDKFVQGNLSFLLLYCFGSLMDIDKFVLDTLKYIGNLEFWFSDGY